MGPSPTALTMILQDLRRINQASFRRREATSEAGTKIPAFCIARARFDTSPSASRAANPGKTICKDLALASAYLRERPARIARGPRSLSGACRRMKSSSKTLTRPPRELGWRLGYGAHTHLSSRNRDSTHQGIASGDFFFGCPGSPISRLFRRRA